MEESLAKEEPKVKTKAELAKEKREFMENEALKRERIKQMKEHYRRENEMLELVTTNLRLSIEHSKLTKEWAEIQQVEEAGKSNDTVVEKT